MKIEKPSEMALIFQYGSNMSSKRINSKSRLNGCARFIGVAYTKDNYELEFTVWSKTNKCATANIKPCNSGRKIWGALYVIPWSIIKWNPSGCYKTLDSIEGECVNYKRQAICIRDQNDNLIENEVQTYLGKSLKSGIKTSLKYVKHIIFGLREHNISDDYVKYIKSQVIENNSNLKKHIESF